MNVTRDNELHVGTVMMPFFQNPNSSLPRNTNISQVPSYYNFSSHSTNLLALNHHLADGKSRSSDQFNELQPLGSSTSRWNPTPEQLLALEEMFQGGTRTPSAEEIQHIASQLRRFGKIEGKNVFYWFQNHKARERQKRRRREMETNNSEQKQHNTTIDHHNIPADKKDSGMRMICYDIEQTKNWAPSSNCSKHSEEFVSMHRAVAESTSCGPHYGWTQFDERELQQRKSCTSITAAAAEVMNATWQNMEYIPSLEYKKLLKTDHQNFIAFSLLNTKPYHESFNSNENEETQTLELFPLQSRDDGSNVKDSNKVPIRAINDINNFTPSTSQYIEFLPLKN